MEHLLIIVLVLVIFLCFIKKSKSGFNDAEQDFFKKNESILNGISKIINDQEYTNIVNQVPGQIELVVDPKTVQITKEYNKPTGTPDLKKKDFIVSKTKELLDLYNKFIIAAQNDPVVYTPDRLKALTVYYQNKIDNCKIILNYFS